MEIKTAPSGRAVGCRATAEKENSRCFNCHSLGHFSTECPQPQMLLCYNCRELGHKTYECTKHLSCRGCGITGHKERQCPQSSRMPVNHKGGESGETTTPPSGARKMVDPIMETPLGSDWAGSSSRGDGLLRLPGHPPVRGVNGGRSSKREKPPAPVLTPVQGADKRPPFGVDAFQDILSSYLDTILSEPGTSSPPNEVPPNPPNQSTPPGLSLSQNQNSGHSSSPAAQAKPYQNQLPEPDPPRTPSPARSAPEIVTGEEEDLLKSRFPRGSSLQRAEKAARHLSFAAGGPDIIDYVAETSGVDRLEPSRPRAGSSHTRMLESSSSWLEDETEWDGATMSFDNRHRQPSFCFDLLGRRSPSRRRPSPLDALLPREDLNVVTGTSSTQIAFSFPIKEVRTSIPNEFASKYQPSTNVVGRVIWIINPALFFETPRSDWEAEDFYPAPPRPPTLAVSAPMDENKDLRPGYLSI